MKIYTVCESGIEKACSAETEEEAKKILNTEDIEEIGNVIHCAFFGDDDPLKDSDGEGNYNVYLQDDGTIYDASCSPVGVAKIHGFEDVSMVEYDCLCTYEWDGNNHKFIDWEGKI